MSEENDVQRITDILNRLTNTFVNPLDRIAESNIELNPWGVVVNRFVPWDIWNISSQTTHINRREYRNRMGSWDDNFSISGGNLRNEEWFIIWWDFIESFNNNINRKRFILYIIQ